MTSPEMAEGYLRQAEDHLAGAELHVTRKAWAAAVRESQEAVELALKAVLRFVGVEPLRTHDPAGQLASSKARFPAWFAECIPGFVLHSKKAAEDRGPAFYGDEKGMIPPGDLFDEEQGREAFDKAREIVEAGRKLIDSGGTSPRRAA